MDGSPMFEAMVQREFAKLLQRAPGCSRNTRVDYALAALRMTHEQAYALAVERVAARMGRKPILRQLSPS